MRRVNRPWDVEDGGISAERYAELIGDKYE